MKKLTRLVKDHKYLCFLDFEGTQFTHEMIAFGAVFVLLDKNGLIKKMKKPIKVYVKAKNKIGSYVTNLTGITEETLKEKGLTFYKAMNELRNYCGSAFKKCKFMTFGNHDLKILNSSCSYNLDLPKDIVAQIQHNYIDFTVLISEFVKDPNGNPYSLLNYCKLFNVREEGIAHEPDADAINLAHLYNAFINTKDLVLEEYLKLLANQRHLPPPIKAAVEALAAGKDFSAEEFKEIARKYID